MKPMTRFAMKFDITNNGCWNWLACILPSGYGQFYLNGKHYAAHRASWELYNGVIPDKLFVLHKCDNRRCVNPEHLFLGTTTDNMRDMVKKGRWKCGIKSAITESNVIDIKKLRNEGLTYRALAKLFNFKSHKSIINIINNKTWIFND